MDIYGHICIRTVLSRQLSTKSHETSFDSAVSARFSEKFGRKPKRGIWKWSPDKCKLVPINKLALKFGIEKVTIDPIVHPVY
jgi:hypothetical protein